MKASNATWRPPACRASCCPWSSPPRILGALAVIVGWQARWAALALAGFCILTAVFFHTDFGDFNQKIHFMKNLAIAGGFLFLVARGPGPWSLDASRAAARVPAP